MSSFNIVFLFIHKNIWKIFIQDYCLTVFSFMINSFQLKKIWGWKKIDINLRKKLLISSIFEKDIQGSKGTLKPRMVEKILGWCPFCWIFLEARNHKILAKRTAVGKRWMFILDNSKDGWKLHELMVRRIACEEFNNGTAQRPDIAFWSWISFASNDFRSHPIRASSCRYCLLGFFQFDSHPKIC